MNELEREELKKCPTCCKPDENGRRMAWRCIGCINNARTGPVATFDVFPIPYEDLGFDREDILT